MTEAKFQALAHKYLIPHMAGFGTKGALLFAGPIRYYLRGYCFESSGFDSRRFCVEVFVQPLFVPCDHVEFPIGDRLGSIRGKQEEWWTLDDDNDEQVMADVHRLMKREGSVILNRFNTLKDFVKNAISKDTNPYSPYPPEMVAYGAILIGDAEKAHKMFDRLEWTLRDDNDREPYEDDILKRARRVRETFTRDPDAAVAILNRWREETAAHLKLTKFLAPLDRQESA